MNNNNNNAAADAEPPYFVCNYDCPITPDSEYSNVNAVYRAEKTTIFLTSGHALNDATCKRLGIRHILCCAKELGLQMSAQSFAELSSLKMIALKDNTDYPDFLEKMNEMADYIGAVVEKNASGGPNDDAAAAANLAVVCHAGVSRSAAAVLSYFSKYLNIPPERGVDMLREARQCVNPYAGFLREIDRYWQRYPNITMQWSGPKELFLQVFFDRRHEKKMFPEKKFKEKINEQNYQEAILALEKYLCQNCKLNSNFFYFNNEKKQAVVSYENYRAFIHEFLCYFN